MAGKASAEQTLSRPRREELRQGQGPLADTSPASREQGAAGLSLRVCTRPPSSSPCTPSVFPSGKLPLWPLVLVQLDSPQQDMPGGTGRRPGLLREMWKNPKSRNRAKVPRAPARPSLPPPNKGNKADALSETRRAEGEPQVGSRAPWGLVLALPPATCCVTLSNYSPQFPPP